MKNAPQDLAITVATIADIPEMHRVRLSVRENRLGDPSRVTRSHYENMIQVGGKGWVAKIDGQVRGLSFADRDKRYIWALFVEPGFDRRGLGRGLHDHAVGWLFEQSPHPIWLTTDPGTRAEGFYTRAGWECIGTEPNGEYRLELKLENWKSQGV